MTYFLRLFQKDGQKNSLNVIYIPKQTFHFQDCCSNMKQILNLFTSLKKVINN